MLGELRAPATRNVAGMAERAGFAGEGGDECFAVHRELVWTAHELKSKRAKSVGGIGSRARVGAAFRDAGQYGLGL